MPVESRHPLYDAMKERWTRCRDAFDGSDAIKAKGDVYLPKPGGLDDGAYRAYVKRGSFYEAVGRTISGFVGAIARKDPVIVCASVLDPVLEDATIDGVTLAELIKNLCAETLLQARCGILVDFDEKLNRAYLNIWQAESIINWSKERIVLNERVYEPDPADEFKILAIDQFRELSLLNGVYTVTLWRRPKNPTPGQEWTIYDVMTPHKRGVTFDEIPFIWVTPLGKTSRIESPPLLGLVDICISHYLNSTDLEHGLHFTGLPTLYVTGVGDKSTKIQVGSMAAIILPEPDSKVAYAEFNGDGLGALERSMAAKEQKMAVLGASVFHDGPKGVEAAETARIRTTGETSLLVGITTAVEAAIVSALTIASEWMGSSQKVEVTLNRVYNDIKIDGAELTGLVQAFQAGALTIEQFLFNMQQADLLAPDTDIDEEVKNVALATAKRAKDAITLAQKTKAPTNNND